MPMPRVKIVGPNICLPTVLGVVFIVLKLTGVIDWSWWIVLLPLYLPMAMFLAFAGLVVFLMWIAYRDR